eukprot:1159413-Pelagomonas_calceolata.AAC.4
MLFKSTPCASMPPFIATQATLRSHVPRTSAAAPLDTGAAGRADARDAAAPAAWALGPNLPGDASMPAPATLPAVVGPPAHRQRQTQRANKLNCARISAGGCGTACPQQWANAARKQVQILPVSVHGGGLWHPRR